MAADKNVELVFRANTGKAAKDVRALGKDLTGIGSQAAASTSKAQRGFNRFSDGARKSSGAVDKLEKNIVQLRVDLEWLEQQRDKSFDPAAIRRYNAEIEELNRTIRDQQSVLPDGYSKSMGGKLAGMAGRLAAGAGIAIAFQRGISRAIEKGSEFESKLADLEAITGITGERLDRLGNRSLELSTKYGTAASDIVEANKLVASVLAEKIDFGTEEGFQQLQSISEQAVVLQKAAGIDLADAVNVTASAINQFNLNASEADRVINTLAAGSKYGAAEVPAIGRALENAGVAGAGAGQKLETVNAAIQVLAANAITGEKAGTALRAVFLRLQTSSEELASMGIQGIDLKANGLTKTLRQLAPLVEDAAAMKKIFGEEAFNAASALIREADAVEALEEKVTGTNTAYEQSAVRMDTFEGATDKLSSTIDKALIPAFTASSGVVVKLINGTAKLIENFAGGLSIINGWLDVHSDLKEELLLTANAADIQLTSIKNLRTELVEYSRDNELSIAQQEDVQKAYDANIQRAKDLATAHYNERAELLKNKKAKEEQIATLEKLIKTGEGWNTPDNKRRLKELKSEVEALNLSLSKNASIIEGYEREVQDALGGIEEELRKIEETKAAEELEKLTRQFQQLAVTPFLSDEQQKKLDALQEKIEALGGSVEGLWPEDLALNDELKLLQQQYSDLINQPSLDEAGIFQATQVQSRINEIERLIRKYQELINSMVMPDDDKIPTMTEKDLALPDDIYKDSLKLFEEQHDRERSHHDERMAWVDQEKKQRLDAEDKIHASRMAGWETYVQAVASGIGNISGLFSAIHERKIQELEREKEQSLENINAELAQENLSEQRRRQLIDQRTKTEEAFQKQIDAHKKKQFNLDKAANISAAIMQTAIAVTEALPNVILAGIVGGLGAAQVATIAAQPNPYADGGWIGGRRHRDGGTIIEAEKDEFITNRRSAPEAARTLTYINSGPSAAREVEAIFDAWRSGRLPVASDGGFISPVSSRPTRPASLPADFEHRITAAIREGMRGVIVDAHVAIDRVDEELGRLQDFKKRIGN